MFAGCLKKAVIWCVRESPGNPLCDYLTSCWVPRPL